MTAHPSTITLNVSRRLPLADVCNPGFLQAMINRCIVGYHRYGSFRKIGRHSKSDIPCLTRLKECVSKYQRTGNLEYLVDVANYAQGEFTSPAHPKAHFHPIDQGEKSLQPH
jgi:hypothetical protein